MASIASECYSPIDRNEQHNSLLANPEFLLLHVPGNGEKLRLVRPADDPELQEQLREGSIHYYALSHLWSIPDEEKENHMWKVGSFIDDENGEPAEPIPMRAEKRDTLRTLLHRTAKPVGSAKLARPSCPQRNRSHRYLWIDVLCARIIAGQEAKEGSITAEPSGCCNYWWIDVLCARFTTPLDIMGSIYAYCEKCYAMVDCKPQILQALSDGEQRKKIEDDYYYRRHKDETFSKDLSERVQLVHQLTKCQWFKRVWTWQEAILPPVICMVAETSGKEVAEYYMADEFVLKYFLEGSVLTEADLQALKMIDRTWSEIKGAQPCTRFAPDDEGSPILFVHTFESLGNSTRTCMDPVDYVYGVLGILGIFIERMEDHQAVWEKFLAALKKRIQYVLDNSPYDWEESQVQQVVSISISEKAYDIDLSTVRDMAGVYDGLLDVTYDKED